MSLIPPSSAESFLDLDGGRVRVLRSTQEVEGGSDRAPLLLIHGGGTDHAAISWFEMFEAFGAERDVIALDLPGFGRTTSIAPLGGPQAMADFVARAARALALPAAVIVGVSMGGDVALNVALRHPALARALVLIGPGGLVPVLRNRPTQCAAWLLAQLPDMLLLPMARLANRYVDRALRAMVTDVGTLPPQVVEEFIAEARRPDGGIAYGRYNQAALGPFAMRNDLLPVVDRITVPTLFFHGAEDPLVDPEGSRRASARMPDARLVLVPGCGHWAQLEAGDRFREEMRAFLAELD